jgi:DNA-directed RNA polymerase subunit RPC12/RpoP
MKDHYCPPANVKKVPLDITFHNPVERMPPQRELYNIQHRGFSKNTGRPYTYRLARLDMEDVRENFAKYKRDLPAFQGNMELVQYWVDSMWGAMYNPVMMRYVMPEDFLDHPRERKRKPPPDIWYQLLHGHHRLRLLDALDANHIWVYMATGHHHGHDLPADVRTLRKLDARIPKRGTRNTTCEKCGTEAPVSSKKHNDFNIDRWYTCPRCNYKNLNYQPYPERI